MIEAKEIGSTIAEDDGPHDRSVKRNEKSQRSERTKLKDKPYQMDGLIFLCVKKSFGMER